MNFKKLLIGIALTVCGSANAATIFAPTDGDVNFLFANLDGGTLAMFDDSDQSYSGLDLSINVLDCRISLVQFTNNDHIATNGNGTLTSDWRDQFILGLNWVELGSADTSVVSQGANSHQVSFNNAGTLGS